MNKQNSDYVGGSAKKQKAFGDELRTLINRHSLENDSNTPDIVLACYLLSCLRAFNCSINSRSNILQLPITNSSIADDYSTDD